MTDLTIKIESNLIDREFRTLVDYLTSEEVKDFQPEIVSVDSINGMPPIYHGVIVKMEICKYDSNRGLNGMLKIVAEVNDREQDKLARKNAIRNRLARGEGNRSYDTRF